MVRLDRRLSQLSKDIVGTAVNIDGVLYWNRQHSKIALRSTFSAAVAVLESRNVLRKKVIGRKDLLFSKIPDSFFTTRFGVAYRAGPAHVYIVLDSQALNAHMQ